MIGSTMPLVERLDWHPVHRANALLRRALLSSTASSPHPAEIWDERLSHPFTTDTEVAAGPVSITHPTSLAALLGIPSISDEAPFRQPPVTEGPDGAAAYAPMGGAAEGPAMLDATVQVQLHGLVRDFYRRQRQASLLVAFSIAIAFALTLAGLLLLFSVTEPEPAEHEDATPRLDTSVAWDGPGNGAPAFLERVRVTTNLSAKSAPLLIRAKAGADAPSLGQAASGAQTILVAAGRPVALAPFLPVSSARYLLLRGLPKEAHLSAGRETGAGTWMVKGEDVPGLTLTLADGAGRDYPIEVYLLGTRNGPQARRNFVLRVGQTPRVYAAGLDMGWPMPLSDAKARSVVTAADLGEPVAGAAETEALLSRARRLLGEGDISAARLLLTHLAERGEDEAAYELARTFDRSILESLGAQGIDGDDATARAWYARASQEGHARAAQRLKILASLPNGGSAD
jgi:hypothetical protein